MELVRRKLVESRTEARRAIEGGLVRVGSNPSPKPSTMVSPDEPVHLVGVSKQWVSRAGAKLDGALELFEVDVDGLRAIDVGASTGGFTDCLLQRGATEVTAMDVGYGQLHWRIRSDDRVRVIERANVRTAPAEDLGAPFDLVVADLSFISLAAVAKQLAALGTETAIWILLIKPQFEAGKEHVDRGGIVRDLDARATAIESALSALDEAGIGCQSLGVSSITGATGNVEFIAEFRRAPREVGQAEVEMISRETPV